MTKIKIINTILLAIISAQSFAQFNDVFNLSDLNGQNGFIINGEQSVDFAQAQNVGDVNGDGISDIITGASGSDISGLNAGAAYVVYGSNNGFSTEFNLNQLDGTNGFSVYGFDSGLGLGSSVSGSKDINDDGIDDIIINASEGAYSGNNYAGSSYVIFGRQNNFPETLDLTALDGSNGFVITGANDYDRAGFQIQLIDDFNGDFIEDIMISTPETDINGQNTGSVYVVFGTNSGFPSSFNLSSLNGSNGFTIHGQFVEDHLGRSITSGDINGDDLTDLVITGNKPELVPNSGSQLGSTYVIFGNNLVQSSTFDLNSLNGANGFVVKGDSSDVEIQVDGLELFVSTANLNEDEFQDIIISYPESSKLENYAGAVYVIYGSDQGFPMEFDLLGLDGTNGFEIKGTHANERLGFHNSSAGDINNDGYDDLQLSTYINNGNLLDPFISGYIIFSNPMGFDKLFDPTILDGNNGFKIKSIDGTLNSLTTHMSSVDDINADGISDLLLNTTQGEAGNSVTYVLFGRADIIFKNGFE